MIKLLKCEFKKFKRTYINSLSFIGMLSPVVLVFFVFLLKKSDFIKNGGYNWDNFNQQLSMFFVFLVGPIITSFIAVFSIYYEFQVKTMKNMLTSPHGRIKIMLAKIIYVSVYVILQYAVVTIINILCALILGFKMDTSMVLDYSGQLMIAGVSTIILVPFMMFGTLLFKSFIPSMVITVAGTISNVLLLNWEKSYLSPWAVSADLMLTMAKKMPMNIAYPIISTCIYFTIFMIITLIYFNRADQTA